MNMNAKKFSRRTLAIALAAGVGFGGFVVPSSTGSNGIAAVANAAYYEPGKLIRVDGGNYIFQGRNGTQEIIDFGDLSRFVDQLEQETEKQKKQISTLKNKTNAFQKKQKNNLDRISAEVQNVKEQLPQIKTELDNFAQDIDAINKDFERVDALEERVEKLKGLKGQLNGVKKELSELQDRMGRAEDRLDDAEGRLDYAEGRLTDIDASTIEKIEKISNGKYQLVRKNGDKLPFDFSDLYQRTNKLKDRLNNQNRRIKNLRDQAVIQQIQTDILFQEVDRINSDLAAHQRNFDALANDVNSVQRGLQQAFVKISEMENKLNGVENRVSAIENHLAHIEQHLRDLDDHVADLEDATIKEVRDNGNGIYTLVRYDGSELKIDLSKLYDRTKNLEAEVAKHKERLSKIEDVNAQQQLDIENLTKDILHLEEKIEKNRKDFDQFASKTNLRLNGLEKRATDLEKEVEKLQARVLQNEAKIAALEARVNKVEDVQTKWAQCFSGIGIAAIPLALAAPLQNMLQVNMPLLNRINEDLAKRLGLHNPHVSKWFEQNVQLVNGINAALGLLAALGLMAYAAKGCSAYMQTDAAQKTPLGQATNKINGIIGSSTKKN